ncbi:MAG TPA: flagellar hook-length control protein FliK, partial [Noviherbaspirillum sp.]
RPTFLLSTQAGSANASLSATGRLIDQLLQGAGQDADAGAVRASTPLLGSASADAGQLAANLRQALSSSGLFYEAHLQEWIAGSRSTAELAEEPQARFADRSATQGTQGSELGRLSQGLRELGNDAQALLRMIRDAHQQQASLQADAHVIARPQAGPAALDPELARLVQSQLHTLEQQQVRWQGELWPGQHMEWDVTEERPHDDPERREGSAWTSVVRFELPHLGPVEATLRLVGEHVQLQIRTEGDAAVTSLRAHAPLLAEALDAAGSPLAAFQVQRGEETGDEHST